MFSSKIIFIKRKSLSRAIFNWKKEINEKLIKKISSKNKFLKKNLSKNISSNKMFTEEIFRKNKIKFKKN